MSAQQISFGLPDPFFTDNDFLTQTPFAQSDYIPSQNVLSRTGAQYLTASQVLNPLIFQCSGGGVGFNSTYQLPTAANLLGFFEGNVNQNSILRVPVYNLSSNGGAITLNAGTGSSGSVTFLANSGAGASTTGTTSASLFLQWTSTAGTTNFNNTGPSYSIFANQPVPGTTGPTGYTGYTGTTGYTGPAGAAGGLLAYGTAVGDAAAAVVGNAAIVFDLGGTVYPNAGITVPAPGGTAFTILTTGVYEFSFYVAATSNADTTESVQIGIFINGAQASAPNAAGYRYQSSLGSTAGNVNVVKGEGLISLTSGASITLNNVTNSGTQTINFLAASTVGAGVTQAGATRVFTLKRIA
jgi:hypothetical protein